MSLQQRTAGIKNRIPAYPFLTRLTDGSPPENDFRFFVLSEHQLSQKIKALIDFTVIQNAIEYRGRFFA